jgi:hypothetical protein
MTQKSAKARASGANGSKSGAIDAKVVVRNGGGEVRFVYTFGTAELRSTKVNGKPSPETLEQSRIAMRELGGRLLKPGVKLPNRKGVPKFYADEADPALVVRELDGKRERGRFVNGQFKAVA